jgi:hypothetical protein
MVDATRTHKKGWARPKDKGLGYTGHMQHHLYDEVEHPLDIPYKRGLSLGYSGFIPNSHELPEQVHVTIKPAEEDDEADLREHARNLDIVERYTQAVEHLSERGQSQLMLLRLVQNKMAERVKSYADQKIAVRLLFEAHDVNQDHVLDEREFRICLEKINVQLDDVQALALFAVFDTDYSGFMDWTEFAERCMVHNPKGGTAVLPKSITSDKNHSMWAAGGSVEGLAAVDHMED